MTEQERLALKAMPYQKFLKTPFWCSVRAFIIKRAQYMCEMCALSYHGRQQDPEHCPLQVHHRTYEHHGWEDEYPGDLIALCPECHERVTKKPHLQNWPYREDRYLYPEGKPV